MRNVFSAIALVFAIGAMSSQAQAVFTKCSLDFEGKNGNFLVIDGSRSKGTLTCSDAVGNEKSEKVRVSTIGLAADLNIFGLIGRCDIEGNIEMAGVGLTWDSLFDIFALAEVNSLHDTGMTYSGGVSASASAVILPQNVQAMAGTISYGKGCKRLAGVKVGTIMSEKDYQRKLQEQQDWMDNYGGR